VLENDVRLEMQIITVLEHNKCVQRISRRCGFSLTLALAGMNYNAKELAFMKTQYYTATSLDGFIATEDDSLDWLFPLGNVNETSYPAFIDAVGALVMGSATYEWMLRHADKVAAETGSSWPYAQPAWIFSSRELPSIEGANTHFVKGDVRPVHTEMRKAAGSKNIWIMGGGDLAGQFLDVGLLDEIIVHIGSVTLWKGKPLFPRRVTSPPLRLLSVRQVGTGFAELRYEVPRSDTDAT
jgi:dihydrofolate reductase